jgi:thioredoxin-related protein/predicted DNA-binding protein
MERLLLLLTLLPIISFSQSSEPTPGIRWAEGLSWQQVKEKARNENKYILIDCKATWCIPCKKMEEDIFTRDSVGDLVNEKFIALQVQMDSSKRDNAEVQKRYADAKEINSKYKINAYPTILFLSPTGELVHKGLGYQNVESFVSLCQDALTPGKQLYRLLDLYSRGIKNYPDLKNLANLASMTSESKIGHEIAMDYIDHYLLSVNTDSLYTSDNLTFIIQNTVSTDEKGFQLIYKNQEKVNKVLQKTGYAESWIDYLITIQHVEPVVKIAKKLSTSPDWTGLQNTIKKRFSDYFAKRTITNAKSRWYAYKKNWAEYGRYSVEYVETYATNMEDFYLAERAWMVFLHSQNKKELEVAINWSKKIISKNKDSSNVLPSAMDTYANLLFKIDYLFGHLQISKRAIESEERALAMASKNAKQKINDFRKTLENMQQGVITWE